MSPEKKLYNSSKHDIAPIASIAVSKQDPKTIIQKLIKWQKPQISSIIKPDVSIYKDSKINPKLVRKSSIIEHIVSNNLNRYSTTINQNFLAQESLIKEDSLFEEEESASSKSNEISSMRKTEMTKRQDLKDKEEEEAYKSNFNKYFDKYF
jgi:hypothetical protein